MNTVDLSHLIMGRTADSDLKVAQLALDQRFLKIVDKVLKVNKLTKTNPYTENALSLSIYTSREIIAKIRRGDRSTNMVMIQNMAQLFNLDLNCFFREMDDIYYVPKQVRELDPEETPEMGEKEETDEPSATSTTTTTTTIEGNKRVGSDSYKVKGQVYQGGQVYNSEVKNYISQVVKLIPEEVQEQYKQRLRGLYASIDQLTTDLDQKTEDLRKVSNMHDQQMKAQKEKNESLQAEKDEITRKYIALLESKM